MHTTFEQKITLDLTVSKIQNVHCSQDDDFSRTLLITLSDNGKPYPIPQNDILCLKISKPDHTFVYIDETDENHLLKNADGTVSVVLSQQMTSVPGICRAELQIISADGMITSCNFNIIVKKSVLSDTEISSTIESNIVQKMVRHLTDSLNPHNVTKDQVGLGNADNTADIDKNVNSSEKLTTARNINGTSFDGTEDIVTDKWGKSRTLTLSGDVSASTPLDGSSDIDLAVTVRDDSHNHTVNSISDLTATAAELNVLDGLTATTNDLNHTAGVTDNIQTQLDAKSPVESPALTGVPTAPTAAAGTDTAQLATTAFTQRAVSAHNTSDSAHADIRNLISALVTRLNAVADSDDETLDQLSEIVAYIKNNKSLIDSITTAKINVTDIVDNLTSAAADKPLSARQGKALRDLIDTLTNAGVSGVKGSAEAAYRTGYVNLTPANIGLANVTNERQYSASNPQPSVAGSSGSCTGNAATATRATQDGNGRNIANTYLPKSDIGSNYSTSLTTSKSIPNDVSTEILTITIGVTGTYLIHAQASFSSNKNGLRRLDLKDTNTTGGFGGIQVGASGSGTTVLQVSSVSALGLAAGQKVRLYARQNCGAALNINSVYLNAIRIK